MDLGCFRISRVRGVTSSASVSDYSLLGLSLSRLTREVVNELNFFSGSE